MFRKGIFVLLITLGLFTITLLQFPISNTPTGLVTQLQDIPGSTQKEIIIDFTDGTHSGTSVDGSGFLIGVAGNSWLSNIIDTRPDKPGLGYSFWDKITFTTVNFNDITYQTRTSQDGISWSKWTGANDLFGPSSIKSPQDKLLQIRLNFLASATLESSTIYYTHAMVFELDPFYSGSSEYDETFQPATRPVVIQGDKFFFDNGDGSFDEAKFYGIQLYSGSNLPELADADSLCKNLRKLGFNSIKTHLISASPSVRREETIISLWQDGVEGYYAWGTPWSNSWNNGTSLNLNETNMQKLDMLISECADEGIYTYLRIMPPEAFKEDVWEGSLERDESDFPLFFIPEVEQHHQAFYELMLNRVNTVTGVRYADNPAIAFYELTNENGMILGWKARTLVGGGPCTVNCSYEPRPNITDGQALILDQLWNQWLLAKYGNNTNLTNAWGVHQPQARFCGQDNNYWNSNWATTGLRAGESVELGTVNRSDWACRYWYAGKDRQRYTDEYQFYVELESNYYIRQMLHIKNDLNAQGNIVGSNYFWPTWGAMQAFSVTDFVDFHGYWGGIDGGGITPMLQSINGAEGNLVYKGAQGQLANKPYTMSEYNSWQGYPTMTEVLPVVANYGAFHGWDAIYYFAHTANALEETENYRSIGVSGYFDPVRTTQFPLLSRAYREWIAPANLVMEVNLTQERQTFLSIQSCSYSLGLHDTCQNWMPHIQHNWLFQHGFRYGDLFSATQETITEFYARYSLSDPAPRQITSDTGELYADDTAGIMYTLHPKYQSAIGLAAGSIHTLPDTTIDIMDNTFGSASVMIGSLDDLPLTDSTHIMVQASSRGENYGNLWNDGHDGFIINTSITYDDRYGTRPVLSEVVQASITIDNINTNLVVYALDENGVIKQEIPSTYAAGTLSFDILQEYETLWYVIKEVSTSFILGDINADGIVDINDLLLAMNTFGLSFGESGYDGRVDLFVDSTINIFDIVIITSNYGNT